MSDTFTRGLVEVCSGFAFYQRAKAPTDVLVPNFWFLASHGVSTNAIAFLLAVDESRRTGRLGDFHTATSCLVPNEAFLATFRRANAFASCSIPNQTIKTGANRAIRIFSTSACLSVQNSIKASYSAFASAAHRIQSPRAGTLDP